MQAHKIGFHAGRRLLAAAALVSMVVSNAVGRSGNYLIITAEAYAGSAPLTQLADARATQGFNVMTYSVAPGTPKETIKDYVLSLWGTPDAPDYILIVGDTPAVPHWNGGGSKHAATDLPYACMDPGDDWYPDIAIGRLSISSVEQLQAIVDKTLFVEAGSYPDPDYVKRGAFLANPSTNGTAEPTHEWVIENYFEPNNYEPIRIYAAQGGNTQDVTDAVNYGCLFVVYFGHSGSSGWSSPSFSKDNVRALSNEGLYGLVFGWSCNTANFPVEECFGETWIREAVKGAAAYISASNYIYWGSPEAWEPSVIHEKSLFAAFFEDDIWEVGPAHHAGLYRFLEEYGQPAYPGGPPTQHADIVRNFFEEFVLLGDPALRLPQPWSFQLQAEPVSRNLCCPPADRAVYTIMVTPSGGFDEAVTLVASGEPAGTTVDFTVNSVVPPFETVMTVSNLIGAPAGEYDIEIAGSAPTFQRSTFVELILSTDAPGSVTLTTPPNGAVDVLRNPTLIWEPASQAVEYDVEIATDPAFVNIVYSVTATDPTYTVGIYLDPLTLYYWRVQANNACGNSGFSEAFSFTTMEQIDHFTEQITPAEGGFDLDYYTVAFVPDGSSGYYAGCAMAANQLHTDPAGGTVLTLPDDGYQAITPAAPVTLYGVEYDTLYVNSNGNITFTGGDTTVTETLAVHFNQPRVSTLFDDLNPAAGGTVSWKETANRVVVTFDDVPEYGTTNSNTFQVELFFTGEIHITWLTVGCNDAIVGLSEGNGLPPGYLETNLSEAGPCDWAWFYLDAVPSVQSVCAPAEAVYTVEVEQMLGFNEPVTLIASGEPTGTTVDFSVNSVVPPFTSVLTVGNTAAGSPGHHNIEITGTATGGMERSALVELNLSTGLPGVVTLTSPPNGAIEVSRIPTLTWQPASQAFEYDLEVATDPSFANVVYSATETDTSHTLGTTLTSATLYYWRVRAHNACGDSGYCPAFSFTTIEQPDYFTEQFDDTSFDLEYFSVTFTPNASGSYYGICGVEMNELPTDPTGGTTITLSDDDYEHLSLSQGRTVEVYNVSYEDFYVGSNGYITFTSGDTDYTESLEDHFDLPRISALFDDLNPNNGGTISWKELDDRAAVTYEGVPEYSNTGSNTSQIEMFYDGAICITWLQVDSNDSIVGLSAGQGLPGDYIESDISAAGPCWSPGDLNCDGVVNAFDIDPFVLALTDPAGYATAWPNCDINLADINGDGVIDAFDIDPFVALLTGG